MDNKPMSYPPLQMTKSEKELRMINRNRKAQDKRDEILAMQNVDIESSFASSKLPEEKRSVEKQIKACLLESLDKEGKHHSRSGDQQQ